MMILFSQGKSSPNLVNLCEKVSTHSFAKSKMNCDQQNVLQGRVQFHLTRPDYCQTCLIKKLHK